MKKARRKKTDELRAEYDFSKLGPAVRGKYSQRARDAGSITVVLSGGKPARPGRPRTTARKAAKRR
jgi:hypothetical protein